MKKINAKNLFDLFCERFATANDGTQLFPTVLIIEFIAGEEIVFYSQESEWFKMSLNLIKDHYSDDTDYDYAYEQDAIIVDYKYDLNSINFEDLINQFDEIKIYTGFSNVSSVTSNKFRHIIALTHIENFSLETLFDYENLIFNHTLSAISNLYRQYQKPIFSKFSFNRKVHTFILHWFESDLNYDLHFDSEENKKVHFSNVLYIEDDVQLILKYTKNDQEAFFAIWLILYRVCLKLEDALANHPLFLPNFKCYPAFFSESQQIKEYTEFAKKNKDLDIDKYIEFLLKELKRPLI